MEQDWEWFDKANPARLYIIKTKSLRLHQIKRGFTRTDLEAWLAHESKGYIERCLKRKKEQKYFTFSGFNDLLDFVKTKKYIPGFVRAVIEKNGEMTIAHGTHRWAAAYLCGIREVQAKLCKRI